MSYKQNQSTTLATKIEDLHHSHTEELERARNIVKTIHFRDMQPSEPYHKYQQQVKGAEYLRKKIIKALTPTTPSSNTH